MATGSIDPIILCVKLGLLSPTYSTLYLSPKNWLLFFYYYYFYFICCFITQSLFKIRLQFFTVSPHTYCLDLWIPLSCANMVTSLLTTFSRSFMSMLNITSPSLCGIPLATFLYMRFNYLFLPSLLPFNHLFTHIRTCLFCCLISPKVSCMTP